MSGLQRFIIFLARICLGLTFLFLAFHNVAEWDTVVKVIEEKNIPFPQGFFAVTKALYALGGLMLLFGWKTRIATFILMVVLGFNAYTFYDFWNMEETEMMQAHMKFFALTVGLFGGLLYSMACGAGCLCCDDTACTVIDDDD